MAKIFRNKKDNEGEIFKVQRPLDTNFPDELALIYNESRSQYGQSPMTQELRELMGADYKVYVRGVIGKDGMLNVIEKVKPQKW